MNKKEIDRLIENICFDNFHATVENCIKEWNIDLKGKDRELLYPVMPPLPDTQDAAAKAIAEVHRDRM
jgi:hypothetical protein